MIDDRLQKVDVVMRLYDDVVISAPSPSRYQRDKLQGCRLLSSLKQYIDKINRINNNFNSPLGVSGKPYGFKIKLGKPVLLEMHYEIKINIIKKDAKLVFEYNYI